MLLPSHNAHITSVLTPPVPADPGLGIAAAASSTRWSGDAQASRMEELIDRVEGNQRVRILATIVAIPSNFPVVPDPEDLITITNLDQTQETLKVRTIDRRFQQMGVIRLICRLS